MFKKKQQGEAEAQQAARSPGKGFKPFLKRNWKRIAAGAVVLVVAGAFLMPRQASPASTSVSYLQDTPQRRSITNVFSDSGTITAANTYEVKPLVRGTVLTADFQEGDMVQAGDVLYTIDSSDAANSVARAQLSLNQAQRSYEDAVNAQYVRTDIGGTVVSIGVAPGDVVTAGQEVATIRDESVMLLTLDFPAADAAGFAVGQTAEVTLDGTYERIAGTIRSVSGADTLSSGSLLVRSVTIAVPNNGSLTAAQAATASVNGVSALGSARLAYQKSQTLAAASAGTVAALCVQPGSAVGAGANVIQLASDSLTRQVETASDNLLSAELSVDDAKNTMDNYTITAPISGTIIQKNVQAGETVGGDSTTAATAMCIIHDLSYLEMTLNVDELQILSMQVGQNVQIRADAIPDQTFNGVVTNVSSAGTTTSGTTTYPVTIRIDDYGQLLPGMNATAEIVVDSVQDALSIPNAAVIRGSYVLVTADSPSAANAVTDMTAPEGYVYVRVRTGISDDDYIQVLEGLEEGDTVAYDASSVSSSSYGAMGMQVTVSGG
ncbi:HlyD family efflux transporter periplasmic adaptor subunit [Faecalibacterium sp. An121]|uniref:HlyD family efflux transporter periplasmic adaptor subunit n=1 Tax=Faecalibacterium sp. An121 TaxID=1965550 RepID=UPI000B374EC4|nr:HlyD family efflux transporter periplasmic adaptor subunit [Faecalibacterium sp. An121]OUQ40292.1 RND transporter [Faecalibacterium sp. An121]